MLCYAGPYAALFPKTVVVGARAIRALGTAAHLKRMARLSMPLFCREGASRCTVARHPGFTARRKHEAQPVSGVAQTDRCIQQQQLQIQSTAYPPAWHWQPHPTWERDASFNLKPAGANSGDPAVQCPERDWPVILAKRRFLADSPRCNIARLCSNLRLVSASCALRHLWCARSSGTAPERFRPLTCQGKSPT